MSRPRAMLSALFVVVLVSAVVTPDMALSAPSIEETYGPWKKRMRAARADLESLKTKRQKAQAEYDEIMAQGRVRGSRIDPAKQSAASSKLDDLDQRIREKEYEIGTTIPDEARRVGVPSSILDQ